MTSRDTLRWVAADAGHPTIARVIEERYVLGD